MLLKFLIIIHKIKLFYLIEYDADYNKILKESIILDKCMMPFFICQIQNKTNL